MVLAVGVARAIGLRAGQDVVHSDHLAVFGERELSGKRPLLVQLFQVTCDQQALCVVPRATSDAVARVNRLAAAAAVAQVRIKRLGAADGRRQLLAVIVGARQPAEIRAVAEATARDEEAHRRIRRRHGARLLTARGECQHEGSDAARRNRRRNEQQSFHVAHFTRMPRYLRSTRAVRPPDR